jgi:predicted acyltransferase
MTNSQTTPRILALDVFRGLTIALMFIVNNPGTWGHIYAPLQHAKWQGWTPTDFVFPFFLFTVGVSAWFSLKKYQNGAPRALYWKIIRRGLLIFLIGLGLNMFLNSLSSYQNLRIMGVLQRIGLAYLIGSLICVSFSRRTVGIIGVLLLLGYWALMHLNSDPSYPYGFWDEVGKRYYGLENNIVTQFDNWLLGANHLYKGYGGIPFDPEGLLSTLPAIATVILGYFTGLLVDSRPDRSELVKVMFLFGLGALVLGLIWDLVFPINKPIWSSSYVVFMAGWCLVINAALIWLIDVQGYKNWTKPLLVLGMNSLLAFVIAGAYVKFINKLKFDSVYETTTQAWNNNAVVPKQIGGYQALYESVFSPITTDYQLLKDVKMGLINRENKPSEWADFSDKQKLSSFLFALFHVLLFWLILWVFYRFNIFLKV